MKRLYPWLAFAGGIIVLALVLPLYQPAQPREARVTRAEAQRIADESAAGLGIAPHTLWSSNTWIASYILEKQLERDPARRAAAAGDPVIGPRLGAYRINYYQANVSKFPPFA